MKTPMEWDQWCDDFYMEEKRYPFWHELVTAIQADACATSNGQKASDSSQGAISPADDSAICARSDQSRYRQLGMSSGDAIAGYAEDEQMCYRRISGAETPEHADAETEEGSPKEP